MQSILHGIGVNCELCGGCLQRSVRSRYVYHYCHYLARMVHDTRLGRLYRCVCGRTEGGLHALEVAATTVSAGCEWNCNRRWMNEGRTCHRRGMTHFEFGWIRPTGVNVISQWSTYGSAGPLLPVSRMPVTDVDVFVKREYLPPLCGSTHPFSIAPRACSGRANTPCHDVVLQVSWGDQSYMTGGLTERP